MSRFNHATHTSFSPSTIFDSAAWVLGIYFVYVHMYYIYKVCVISIVICRDGVVHITEMV